MATLASASAKSRACGLADFSPTVDSLSSSRYLPTLCMIAWISLVGPSPLISLFILLALHESIRPETVAKIKILMSGMHLRAPAWTQDVPNALLVERSIAGLDVATVSGAQPLVSPPGPPSISVATPAAVALSADAPKSAHAVSTQFAFTHVIGAPESHSVAFVPPLSSVCETLSPFPTTAAMASSHSRADTPALSSAAWSFDSDDFDDTHTLCLETPLQTATGDVNVAVVSTMGEESLCHFDCE